MLKEASAESEVFSFMDGIIDQLNTEIAKNWTKAGDVIEVSIGFPSLAPE